MSGIKDSNEPKAADGNPNDPQAEDGSPDGQPQNLNDFDILETNDANRKSFADGGFQSVSAPPRLQTGPYPSPPKAEEGGLLFQIQKMLAEGEPEKAAAGQDELKIGSDGHPIYPYKSLSERMKLEKANNPPQADPETKEESDSTLSTYSDDSGELMFKMDDL